MRIIRIDLMPYVTRAKMVAFLHREAGALADAGTHIRPKTGGGFEVLEWFNNVNIQKPTYTGFLAHSINF